MLTVWQSNRLEILAGHLAGVVRTGAPAPLHPEVVVVQNSGMKRWLSLRIAERLGVCAAVTFPLPAELVWEVFRSVLDDVPARPAIDPELTTWGLMGLLARLEPEARFAPLRGYLEPASAAPGDDVRRYDLARRIAEVFEQYLFFRPDWVRAWARGELVAEHEHAHTSADEAWQAELWRRLVSPGERHFARLEEELHARLSGGGRPGRGRAAAGDGETGRATSDALAALPRRISLFGIPSLPPPTLEILRHLAHHVEVHLFLLNPSRAYWADIRSHRDQARLAQRAGRLDPALLHLEAGNALLASLGRQSRDFVASLLALDDEQVRHEDGFADPGEDTLLHRLQADVLELRERGGAPPDGRPDEDHFPTVAPISPADRSLQVHVCHGAMREVEVLHDQLLALFDANPDLRPCDVVVMTPDIEAYAPCIEAVFATAPGDRTIPFSIADRSLSAESPVANAFAALLELPGSRWDVNRLLDLLELPAIQRRFDLDAEQVELVQRWVRATGIRWGIDESTRRALELPATREHTWAFGLDRLLLGYALPAHGTELFEGILPHDEVEGAEARVLGRLATFTETLFALERELAEPRPPGAWAADLLALLDRVFAPDDQEQISAEAIRRALDELREHAGRAGFADPVSLDLVRRHLRTRLEIPGGGDRFLAGRVTFCAMVPMRSIPFEVVCLIGMNDGVFPRQSRALGFDLTLREPRHGDRSRRDDDRYLFLEALLSARRCLYLSYVGRSIRDNAELPPSVLVSELLDAVRRGFAIEGDLEIAPERRTEAIQRIVEHVVTDHPLQAFSRRYFEGDPRLHGYAREICEALARAEERKAAGGDLGVRVGPLVRTALPEPEGDWLDVDLDRLVRFFANPTRGFLESRLGIHLDQASGPISPTEPFQLDQLEAYVARDELLDRLLAGEPAESLLAALRAAGALPHARAGEAAFASIHREADRLARRLRELHGGQAPRRVFVEPLAAGPLRLSGALDRLTPSGRVYGRPAKVKPKDRIALWIRHLVLCALARDGRLPAGIPTTSRFLGTDAELAFSPVEHPEDHLRRLGEAYRDGLREPLRFFPAASYAYATAKRDPLAAARKGWEGNEHAGGDSADAWVRLAYRDTDPLDERFASLASEILAPLLEHQG